MQAYQHLQPVMSFDDIAAELGCSRQNVHQLYRSALRKMRRAMRPALDMQATLDQRREYAWRSNLQREGAE